MKFIKTFEEQNKKYNIGDYVLTKDQSRSDCYVIITDIYNGVWDYWVSDYDYDGRELSRYPITENDLIRKMTSEEIEDIESIKAIKKYNL